MRFYPSKAQIIQSWEKYSLIVVGNIVFFLLLYFISYRPHNEENRAGEFLSLAQQAEAEDQYQTAMVVYGKVAKDYSKTRAAITAKKRIEHLNRHKPKPSPTPKPKPVLLEPVIDIDKMLDQQPAVYVARFLAQHYDETPELKTKVRSAIADYLRIAINYEGIPLKTIRSEKEFQRPEFQQAFFGIKVGCEIKRDWIYDDFFVRNNSIFPWTNIRLSVSVAQGDKNKSVDVRIPRLRPGQTYEVVSLNVNKKGGDVICRGQLKSNEGKIQFSNRL